MLSFSDSQHKIYDLTTQNLCLLLKMAGNDCESQMFANVPEGVRQTPLFHRSGRDGAIRAPSLHALSTQDQRQSDYAPGRGAIQGRPC